ncbi:MULTISPECIES: hypothetical protein [Shouchella]|uniref:Uncharacterized protein n=1 Tax=Shouchella hunanensis TaxID=766894 RepID=A0ABY7WA67_9BACI|nr:MULTISPECIES: hypothetical protein [Shouchella]WDF05813.1 hypothetical protein PQ477_10370 [Shouchella hunanensis]
MNKESRCPFDEALSIPLEALDEDQLWQEILIVQRKKDEQPINKKRQ